MSRRVELLESAYDFILKDQHHAVEEILHGVREACLEVAPFSEVQSAIDDARVRISALLGQVPSCVEEVLSSHGKLIEAIYTQRQNIVNSGLPLDSPNLVGSRLVLIVGPQFHLSDEDVERLEKNLYDDLDRLWNGKRKKKVRKQLKK